LACVSLQFLLCDTFVVLTNTFVRMKERESAFGRHTFQELFCSLLNGICISHFIVARFIVLLESRSVYTLHIGLIC